MSQMSEAEIYPAIGEAGIAALAAGFYRQIPEDDLLGPMYPVGDLPEAERRLRDFLVFRLGGPQRYIAERGHPRLRLRHAPFMIDAKARDRWIQLMFNSLDQCRFPAEVDNILRQFFEQTATFLINRQES